MRKQSNVTPGAGMLHLYACAMCIANGNVTKKDAGGEKAMRAVDEKLTFNK